MKTVGDIIKEIRLACDLTQKEFAEKFFVTEKTVSNYENGKRMPDLSFLSAVCRELNLTLDYFMEKQQRESRFDDLVIATKNGKYAIFDKYQSVYLTPHIYDGIRLSESGNHIVYRADDLIDEEGKLLKNKGNINFSAICNNNGNLTSFSNIEFGYNGSFNLFNVCPARIKDDGLVHLVDNKGNVLSDGFTRIVPVDSKSDMGIYYGIIRLPYEERTIGRDIIERKLINKDGSIINVTFEDINACFGEFRVLELDTIENLEKYINNYGSLMLKFVYNRKIFQSSENVRKIILAAKKYSENNNDKFSNLMYAVNFLTDIAKIEKIKLEYTLNDKERENFRFYSEKPINEKTLVSDIEMSIIKKKVLNLYKMIGIM
ncbi:MAG: helix-turn-helix transcriptional regulator [Clostridia bacterium]|nr:helix-turn-helix transcriptional regulator [Clostridia bacterium]